jgi:hypothetical protein
MGLIHQQAAGQTQSDSSSVLWNLDRMDKIGGCTTTKLGQPVLIETPLGRSVLFDGIDDGLLITANPLNDAIAFTVEVVFRPDSSGPPNAEQRFLHIQNPDNENRRILIELRHFADQRWFLDTFISSDSSRRTLYAETFQHSVGEWFHAALLYEKGTMRHYVDGREELSGAVNYDPIKNGCTSIGVRMNRRSWFRGAIRTIRMTRRALSPAEFLALPTGIRREE